MHRFPAFVLVLLALAALPAVAQPALTLPRLSPHARAEQTIGLTQLTVDYHRPAVQGRRVWGDLVPLGEVWRAGANENTVFETSTAITVEGQPLAAGRYGLHVIPADGDWTVIFSRTADAWGSYSYTPDEDALRVTVAPLAGRPFQERLLYRFDAPDDAGTTLVLAWETVEMPVRLAVDTPDVVLASMERELRSLPGFYWQGWNQIAEYALDTDRRLPDALGWAERSVEMEATFANRMTRAALLDKLNRAAEATAQRDEAFATASPDEVRAWARARRRAGAGEAADAALARLETP